MMQAPDHDKLRLHVQRLEELPLASPLAASFLDIVSDDEVTISQVAALIRQDPSLVARLVGLANSAYFGQSEPLSSVEDAIFKSLGLRLTKSLVLSMVLADSIGHVVEDSGLNQVRFWLDAVLTASLGRMLSEYVQSVPHPTADEAYLAGMLHQFGILPLVRLYPAEFREAIQQADTDPKLTAQLHRELGTDHHETGAWLARKWHLPDNIVTVIAHQHEADYTGPHAELVKLTRGASTLVGQLLAEEDLSLEQLATEQVNPEAPDGKPSSAQQPGGVAELHALGIPPDRIHAGLRNMEGKLEAMRSLAHVLATPGSGAAHG